MSGNYTQFPYTKSESVQTPSRTFSGLPGMSKASSIIGNFPLSEGRWTRDSVGDLWARAVPLSFVEWFDVSGFTKLYWFEQYFTENTGGVSGNCAFWTAADSAAVPVKVYDGPVLDSAFAPSRFVFPTPLNISASKFVVFATDGALAGGVDGVNLVKQRRLDAGKDSFAQASLVVQPQYAYLGVHLGGANAAYPANALPLNPDIADAKYNLSMYLKLGVG